jgi:uncharacterized repeat protein (TIGR02543 family)
VDDYDNEVISFVPKPPVRDGYEFAGWYKERECINKWDFEVDIVPKKEIIATSDDSLVQYVFKETKLYAKWI